MPNCLWRRIVWLNWFVTSGMHSVWWVCILLDLMLVKCFRFVYHICILLLKNSKERTSVAFFVFGWHYMQGFSLAIKMGATKHDFDRLVCWLFYIYMKTIFANWTIFMCRVWGFLISNENSVVSIRLRLRSLLYWPWPRHQAQAAWKKLVVAVALVANANYINACIHYYQHMFYITPLSALINLNIMIYSRVT